MTLKTAALLTRLLLLLGPANDNEKPRQHWVNYVGSWAV
jgi:hypothetical protein